MSRAETADALGVIRDLRFASLLSRHEQAMVKGAYELLGPELIGARSPRHGLRGRGRSASGEISLLACGSDAAPARVARQSS